MRTLIRLVQVEIRRRTRDPLSFLTWTAIPLLMVFLLVAVFGPGGSSIPRARLLVVDHDQAFLSGLLTGALANERLREFLSVDVVEREAGERELGKGRASALLVIPEGFTEDFFDNRPIELELFRNPAQTILPGVVEEMLELMADAGTSLRSIILGLTGGEDFFDAEPSLAQVLTLSERIFRVLEDDANRGLLDPSAGVQVTHHHPPAKVRSRSQVVGWFAPGFIVMALLFLAQGQSSEIQEDAEAGLLQRAFSYPVSPTLVVSAKALSLILTEFLSAALLAAALMAALGWRPESPLLLAGALLLATSALVGLALFLRSLTRSLTAGNAAAAGVMVGMGFLGGCFFPAQFLPAAFQKIALVTPVAWAVDAVRFAQGGSNLAPGGLAWRLAALGLFAAAMLLFSVPAAVRKVTAR